MSFKYAILKALTMCTCL